MLKKIISYFPLGFQEELKRIRYRRQIKSGSFSTPEKEFLELDNIVSEGDWVIDVGANVGYYTIRLSNLVKEKGRVIAFEPIPRTFAQLSHNSLYSKYDNITLINAAVSKTSSLVNMSIPDFSSGIKNYFEASIVDSSDENSVSVLTFSVDSLELSERISLIKIDAEGHEPFVLEGMKKLIEKDKPILIIETVNDEMRSNFISLGYVERTFENSSNTIFEYFEK